MDEEDLIYTANGSTHRNTTTLETISLYPVCGTQSLS